MPRYRFKWANLPTRMLRDLAKDLDLDGPDPADALRSYYGARPKDDFIRDAWPSLLEVWLAKDSNARQSIVEELRDAGLGEASRSVRTAADQLNYLRSCRNAKSLRDIVLWYFVLLGEESSAIPDLPSPPPPVAKQPDKKREPAASSKQQRPAAATGSLKEWIKDVLAAVVDGGVEPDEDGDFPIRHGSAAMFVRAVEETPFGPLVHFFSPMVRELEPTPALFMTLNELNLGLPLARVAFADSNQVILMCDLPAITLSEDEFFTTCKLVCDIADTLDTRIRDTYGGQTMFDDVDDAVEV